MSAQTMLEVFEKPMPEIKKPLSDEQFLAMSESFSDTPIGNKHLGFEMRYPKEWPESNNVSLGALVIDDKIFSNIAEFKGPVSLRGYRHELNVLVKKIDYQMTAKHWFMKYILETGYNVMGVKVYDERRIDALYVYVNNGESYVVRSAIQINKDDLIFVQYTVPANDYKEVQALQEKVIDSFKLLYPVDELIEKFQTHRILDIATLKYPDSWEFSTVPIKSIDRAIAEMKRTTSVLRHSRRGNKSISSLAGSIGFELISVFASDDIDAEIERFQDDLAASGLFIDDKIGDSADFLSFGTDMKLESHVYKLIDKHSDVEAFEFWITVTASGDYFYYTTLLTPSRETRFLEWARNTQMYRLAVQNFVPIKRNAKN